MWSHSWHLYLFIHHNQSFVKAQSASEYVFTPFFKISSAAILPKALSSLFYLLLDSDCLLLLLSMLFLVQDTEEYF